MRSLVRTETRKLLTSPRWWLVGAGMVLDRFASGRSPG